MLSEASVKSIEELHRLKSSGVITDEEFDQAKNRILFGAPKRPSSIEGIAARRSEWSYPAENDIFGWAMLPLRRYAEFDGRSTRKEFWLFQLIPFAILCGMFVAVLGGSEYDGPGLVGTLAIIVGIIGLLGLIIPQIAVQVRRFHDQNLSGLLALLNLIPYLGGLIVFVFMLLDGTKGENKFGPDPRDLINN
jgi:uncharacterized membrane protein YhaH (DUF805 family)